MRQLGIFLTAAMAVGVMFWGCGPQSDGPLEPQSSEHGLFAEATSHEVIDQPGDADTADVTLIPDLFRGQVDCTGDTVYFVVTLDPDSFHPESTLTVFAIDIDQDPSTGSPGVDTGGNDAAIMGTDYALHVGGIGPGARLWEFGAGFTNSYPVTVLADGYVVGVPLAHFGGDDGRFNYKVTAQAVLGPATYTTILDYMPDLGLEPGMTDPCPVLPVEARIDIKPGSDPNSVNCKGKGNGVIPVALLGSENFDVSEVDLGSVMFEGAMETHTDRDGNPRMHMSDVNDDGFMDLVFHFRFNETDLTCDDTEGMLSGVMVDGTEFSAVDSIRMVPPAHANGR